MSADLSEKEQIRTLTAPSNRWQRLRIHRRTSAPDNNVAKDVVDLEATQSVETDPVIKHTLFA